ncbi:factor-independent urate hydroxylase [Antrihabitans sp. YC2-6]|uniref:factor-independent urate hydroxylase n=1 Tax=Antrihabitans sp. YC2-6 TaxID=2799498 RepID=UPI0018F79ABC|nr:urate oxidase [Antrihabitans sp. YC2-6]MBJ8348928.1 urate oxidase [Antrihabitans sp. YC2-6]
MAPEQPSADCKGRIVLGPNQYGKAESRIVRIYRSSPRHEIRDLNVSTCLRGDFGAAYTAGDQSQVLPTDSQKQTAYAYAKDRGGHSIEEYGVALARHFVDDIGPVHSARIEIDEYLWERATVDGAPHDHTWVRRGQEIRTADVTVDDDSVWVVGGLKDLIILKSTGSEFSGFLVDEFTVLEPTHDRVMATSLNAKWRFTRSSDIDWDDVYSGIKETMIREFAVVVSLALQQTLFEMGKAVLEKYPFIAEVRLSAPNRHHFEYDLARFGIDNTNEVFNAADRPYGLIQATVEREDAPPAGSAWEPYRGWLV